jgi:tRNA threonylcarbamoyl adenosine modification protein YeaZ
MKTEDLVLGIEAAISGGSLSLMKGSEIVDSWIGTGPISRSELLLPEIDGLLGRNGMSIRDLKQLIVSTGPGSFTGIRIGIATAVGLGSARSIECCGMTAFDAIARTCEAASDAVIAVPMGRNMVCVQQFKDLRPTSAPRTVPAPEFIDDVSSHPEIRYILHGDIAKDLRSSNVVDAGHDIADRLCRSIGSANCHDRLDPLFVQQASN